MSSGNPLKSATTAKSLQSCLTLCDPIVGSPPGSPVPGILQARTLEWVAISFSNAWKWKVKVKSLSRIRLLATPWTAAHQAPPSMWFSRQEYWSGVPLPSPWNLLLCIKFSYFSCSYDHLQTICTCLSMLLCVCVLSHSAVSDSACHPWTVAHQAPLFVELSREKSWSRLPFSSLWDLPDTGIKPTFPASPALTGIFCTTLPPGKPIHIHVPIYKHIRFSTALYNCDYIIDILLHFWFSLK